jgi:hypothetical protein
LLTNRSDQHAIKLAKSPLSRSANLRQWVCMAVLLKKHTVELAVRPDAFARGRRLASF